MPLIARATAPLATLAALGLLATACVGAKHESNDTSRNAKAKSFTLRVFANDVAGGKNAAEADWFTHYVIPGFEKWEKSKGRHATVKFQGSGVGDEQYKTKLELDLKTGSAADIVAADGIWIGELAGAHYISPLSTLVGSRANKWSGWRQVPASVKRNMMVGGKLYGIPKGTDGRVIYYNKKLFAKAGLPRHWQPKSWQDILSAGRRLKKVHGVTPIQLDAGTAMGEATTTQGFLPMLAGTGASLYNSSTRKWQGDTAGVRKVLGLYHDIYGGSGLGDPKLQEDQNGRDESFSEFSDGKIGMLLESDYMWRSEICPSKEVCGGTSMPDRSSTVGYALIPAMRHGSGVGGQSYVSISGGTGWLISPSTKYPQQAWDFLTYMNSATATKKEIASDPRLSARRDVNTAVAAGDPLMTFINRKVLPLTRFRPSSADYPQVSVAVQQATADVVAGKPVGTAATSYRKAMAKAVGGSHVTSR